LAAKKNNRMKVRMLVFTLAGMFLVTAFAFGQGAQAVQTGQRGQRGRPAARPAPRDVNGRATLGPLPGELGVFLPGAGGAERLIDPAPGTPEQFPIPAAARFPNKLNVTQVPFQPWAKALFDYRRDNQFEPHTRCKPSGGTRQFLTPYGVEFVENTVEKRVFIFDIGGPHTFRTIFMDGRPHPKDLAPSYYGHSTGRWEGDTLVVDTIGFARSS
jgi:hypothetical protein